jgi:hypothetical protein
MSMVLLERVQFCESLLSRNFWKNVKVILGGGGDLTFVTKREEIWGNSARVDSLADFFSTN